ncbi:MAG: hypothetical protein HY885_16305 [Deltaproteobacteria bacterium]|nr:hypothetical protein [Deltaproteobacteria bacterium]
MKRRTKISRGTFFFLALILILSSSCSYQERVQPVTLPAASKNYVVINGVQISAVAFADKQTAKDSFGFDIRGAGLLPVQVVFQNDGDKPVSLLPEQTFLIDGKNQAWPVNSLERTYARVEKQVDVGETMAGAGKPALLFGAAGAIAGLAVGIVTGENIGESMGKGAAIGAAAGALGGGVSGYQNARGKIKEDLSQKALVNKQILPNQIGYGILFFPGFPEEAQEASRLKLTVTFAGEPHSVTLDLVANPD